MNRRKFMVSLLAGLLAAVLLFGLIAGSLSSYVGAKSSAEIQQELNKWKEQQKKNQAELNSLRAQQKENLNEMKDIVAQKDLIDQEVFVLNEQLRNLNQQITAYNGLIADKQAELDEATARWEELNAKYKERIRAMEEDGKLSYWSVLFKANSFSDLLDRISMIEEIAASDQRRLKELNEAAKVVDEAKTTLEADKIALEVSKKELEESNKELMAAAQKADELLKKLIATGEEYQALIDAAEKKESESAGKVDELEYAYDEAKKREYEEWLAGQNILNRPGATNTVDGITWLLPINYTYFSSPFGYRIHPIHGDWRFHYGVDLAAPQGREIYATRSGVVTTTDYEAGGAGYYVSINHMDGFSTRYMHMTHYIVYPGQYVAQGQVIGYCGSTGGSNGPHLHFGVYYNGVAVNPAKYINIS